jgi:hypothetical protein
MTILEQEKQLAKQLQSFLSVPSPISNAVSLLRRNTSRCFLFGGALRDIIRPDPITPSVRDVDCVVLRHDLSRLQTNCETYFVGKNRFGGLKFALKGVPIDVWAVEDTWAFQKQFVVPYSFYTLTHTTFLNIDGIVADVSTGDALTIKIFARDFLDAFSRKLLNITLSANPFPLLVAVKALRAAYRYDLHIGYDLAVYLDSLFQRYSFKRIEREQLRHYRQIIFDESHLSVLARRLNEYVTHSAAENPCAFVPNDQLSLPGLSRHANFGGRVGPKIGTRPLRGAGEKITTPRN